MTPHPDKIFRDALEPHQRQVPSSAWDRIENNLERRSYAGTWLKVAAGIVILLAVSLLLWPKNTVDPSTTLPEKKINPPEIIRNTPVASTQITSPEPISNEVIISTRQKRYASSPTSKVSNHELKSDQINQIASSSDIGDNKIEIIPKTNEKILPDEIVINTESTPESADAYKAAVSSVRKITYSSEDVNSRFMKKVLPPKATPEPKNTSGLQKVIDIAFDLKYNESLYSELRQKKNEILTFNFPEKKESPNK